MVLNQVYLETIFERKSNYMKTYECGECGEVFKKSQIDFEASYDDMYYCNSCSEFLAEAGRDAVDPDHNFDSFFDWDENGR